MSNVKFSTIFLLHTLNADSKENICLLRRLQYKFWCLTWKALEQQMIFMLPTMFDLLGCQPAAAFCTFIPAERHQAGKAPPCGVLIQHSQRRGIYAKKGGKEKVRLFTSVCSFVCVWAGVAMSGSDQWTRGASSSPTPKKQKKSSTLWFMDHFFHFFPFV